MNTWKLELFDFLFLYRLSYEQMKSKLNCLTYLNSWTWITIQNLLKPLGQASTNERQKSCHMTPVESQRWQWILPMMLFRSCLVSSCSSCMHDSFYNTKHCSCTGKLWFVFRCCHQNGQTLDWLQVFDKSWVHLSGKQRKSVKKSSAKKTVSWQVTNRLLTGYW